MVELVNVRQHLAYHRSEVVRRCCQSLFLSTDVEYFCYYRRFQDGSFTFLASHLDLAFYFAQDNVYPHTWLANINFSDYKNGFLLWDILNFASTPEQAEVFRVVRTELNLGYGIDIIQKFPTYADVYSFASNNTKIYSCPISYLHQFIFYFKQECASLLREVWQDKLELPLLDDSINDLPLFANNEYEEQENTLFDIRRYYLGGDRPNDYVTSTELQYLQLLVKGHSAKSIANILTKSHRTVEHQIQNIKDKLNCFRINELIDLAYHYNLIK